MEFQKALRVVFPHRSLWLNGDIYLENDAHIWYTDGSLMNGKAGVYGSEREIPKALGSSWKLRLHFSSGYTCC